MSDIPTSEPSVLTQGDTVQWLKSLPDYPASAGWSLSYVLVSSAAKITIGSSAQGDDHLVGETAANSAAWAPGAYEWQARVSKGSGASLQAFTVGRGRIEIQRGLAALSGGLDTRTNARKALDAIEAYLADANNLKASSYEIAGRNLARYPISELLKLKSHFQAEVRREEAAERAAAGLPSRGRIYVRFGP